MSTRGVEAGFGVETGFFLFTIYTFQSNLNEKYFFTSEWSWMQWGSSHIVHWSYMDVEQMSTKKVQEMTEIDEIHCSDGQGPVVEIDWVICDPNCINPFLKVVHNDRKPITKHHVQGKLVIC